MWAREAKTNVLCFHPGCRRKAHYKATAHVGLEGGCWLACASKHFSLVTTRGVPLGDEDYDHLDDVIRKHGMAGA